jgi:hypothetical protein
VTPSVSGVVREVLESAVKMARMAMRSLNISDEDHIRIIEQLLTEGFREIRTSFSRDAQCYEQRLRSVTRKCNGYLDRQLDIEGFGICAVLSMEFSGASTRQPARPDCCPYFAAERDDDEAGNRNRSFNHAPTASSTIVDAGLTP